MTMQRDSEPPGLLKGKQKHSKWLVLPFIALFVLFGIVIILKSFAAPAPAGDSNDIINGGFSTGSSAAARSSMISRLGANSGARELYAYFGITDKEINAATLGRGINPRNSGYSNWWSFGRNNNGAPGTQAFHGVPGHTFYVKPVKNAWKSTVSVTGPILVGHTKSGKTFIIHSECGNLAIATLTQVVLKPGLSVVKTAVSPAAGSTVKPGDTVSYRITATSTGNTAAYVRITDSIPAGTTLVSEAVETKNAFRLADQTVNGIKYLVWGNGGLQPNTQVRILLKVKVNADTKSGFCNFALYTWVQGQSLPGKTNTICHNLSNNTPTLKVTKNVTSISESTRVENNDVITYTISGENTGKGASKNATFSDQVANDGKLQFVELGPLLRAGRPVPAAEIAEKQSPHLASGDSAHKYYGYVLKSMAAGDKVSFTIKFKVIGLVSTDTKVCNRAVTYDDRPSPYGVQGYDDVCNPTKTTVITTTVQPPLPPSTPGGPAISIVKEAVSPAAGSKVHVGDTISYKVVVKNTGASSANNVVVNDPFPAHSKGGRIDRHVESNGATGFSDTSTASAFSWKYSSLAPGAQGETYFKVTVQDGKSGDTLCNVATVTSSPGGTSTEICHEISDLVLSKSAVFAEIKDTAGKPLVASESTIAKSGDVIEYSLTTKNSATTGIKDFVVEENLEDVLEYSDLIDNGGGTYDNTKSTLTWKVTIAPGASDVQKFRVKIKSPIPQGTPKPTNPGSYDYKMYNVYGNPVTIPVDKPILQTIIDTLPQTGALGFLMIPLALATALLFAYTSGMIGAPKRTSKHHAAAASATQHQPAAEEAAHRAGQQFRPEADKAQTDYEAQPNHNQDKDES